MTLFVATFSAIAVSAAQDFFELVVAKGRRVYIQELLLGQYSEFGDAQAELLSVLFVRGYTTAGSGGAAVTPVPLIGASGERAISTVARNNTTVAQDGTANVLRADAMNVAAGYRYYPAPEDRIWLEPEQRLVIRGTAPADGVTMNGTLVFREQPV